MSTTPTFGLLNVSSMSNVLPTILPTQIRVGNETIDNKHHDEDLNLVKILSIVNTFTCWLALVCVVFGVVGNTAVVLVQSRAKKISVYRLLIMHLAFADLLYTFLHILWTHRRFNKHEWVFGTIMCKLTFLWPCAISCSMFTIAFIAVERHRSIIYPFAMKWRLSKVLLALVGCWISAIVLQIPFGIMKGIRHNGNRTDCLVRFPPNRRLLKSLFNLAVLVATYPIPLSIIGYCYLHIGWRALHGFQFPGSVKGDGIQKPSITSTNIEANMGHTIITGGIAKKSRKYKKLLVMLALVVITFVVTTTPNQAMILWFEYADMSNTHINDLRRDFIVLHLLSSLVHLHACMNPIIYCIMDQQFRTELKVLCLSFRRWAIYSRPNTPKIPKPLRSTAVAGSQKQSTRALNGGSKTISLENKDTQL